MPVLHEQTSPATLDACRLSPTPCPACTKRSGGVIAQGTQHGYGSEPRGGWTPRRVGEADATAPTFGVELETQTLAGRDRRTALTTVEACAVTAPRGFWHPTQDGSVNGPEFASQPGTLAYWRSITGPLGQMMSTLSHGGMRSHDGPQSCSLHVNVGRDAFGDADHLARFIRLVSVNARWTTRLAQRTHDQMSWARCDAYPDMAACQRVAREYFRDGYAYTGHTAVVNLESAGRVEFRAPRGSLRLSRVLGKIEWTAAMVEFTRDPANRPVPGAFTTWALARRADYPELFALMADLTPARVAERPAVTRPAATVSTAPICRANGPTYPYARCDRSEGHYGAHGSTYGTWL